jgi:tetratricopeptide (TPR) repeat protein
MIRLTPVAAQAGRLALLVTVAGAPSAPYCDRAKSTTTAQAGGSAAQARPVDQASIEELVQMYRSGRHEEAVSPATLWSAERITLEIGRLIAEEASAKKVEEREVLILPSLDVAGLERHASLERAEQREVARLAAAAIVAESALSRLRNRDIVLLAPGLSTASLLLEVEPLGARGRSFAQRFYLLAGLVLQWHVEIAAGRRLLTKALRYFPGDPALHTVLGSMTETVASLRTYPLPPGSPEAMTQNPGGYSSERGGYGGVLPDATLGEAEVHYAQALLFDPKLDEARLRLAHVRLLNGRTEDALRDLERVATEARQPRQRYLARLFAGYARQRLGDLKGAVAAYRASLAHGPRAQTALLALGRSLDQLGDQAGAQEAFASASALDAPFDPWWSYGAGQPERFDDLVAELRGLVK